MARVAIVDGSDRFVAWTDKVAVHRDRLVHRAICVLVHDGDGRLLVQQRSASKLTDPGRWDASCAGHVEEDDYVDGPDGRLDEVYCVVAVRELREELGIDVEPVEVWRSGPVDGVHYEQMRLFVVVHRGPFALQAEEVAAVRWVDGDGLRALLATEHHTATLDWLVPRIEALGLARRR
jgi:isopentenyl-diphosphate Delta-isomerase